MDEAHTVIEAKKVTRGRGKWAMIVIVMVLAAVLLVPTWLQVDRLYQRHRLFVAIRSKNLAMVEALLKAGADPNLRDAPPSTRGNLVDRLLNPRGQPAYEDQQPSPLLAALYRVQVDRPGWHMVTFEPNPSPAIVRALISHGASVNAAGPMESLPITFAAASGNTEVVDILLRSGADVNQTDLIGNSLLLTAAGQGRTEMVQFLIARGADVHARNNSGETALICAVRYCRMPEMVELLLQHKVDPNIRDIRGKTALFYARNPAAALSSRQTRRLPQVITILTRAGAR
jgi:ankyrin repeat protein